MNPLKRLINRFRPSKILRRELDAAMNRWLRDIDFGLRLRAIMASADFVYENIPLHKRFDGVTLRQKSLELAPAEGMILEFGVFKGYWINQFASWTNRRVSSKPSGGTRWRSRVRRRPRSGPAIGP